VRLERKRNRERERKERNKNKGGGWRKKRERKRRVGSGQSDPVFSETLPTGHNPNSNPFNKPNPKPV
jgi:hypothetical protein